MPHDLMTKCEQKKQLMADEKRVWKWVEVKVSKIIGTPHEIRCLHCHGVVRLHKQRVNHGPQDHVEHRSKQDSEHCPGGHYYNGGAPRLSTLPVT